MRTATERSPGIDVVVPIRPGMVTFDGDPTSGYRLDSGY
jgi:hypothetical protein